MATNLEYSVREFFEGNKLMTVAEMTGENTYQNAIRVTGLVEVSEMEDQAEVVNFAADDVVDHVTIKSASLYEGSMKFIQTDPKMRTEFLGQGTTENGAGFYDSGNYPKRVVQYVSEGTRKDGTVGVMVTVYPNMSAKGAASKATKTKSSDTPEAIMWTVNVQASASEHYKSKGRGISMVEYFYHGEDVAKVIAFIEKGGIITPSYQVTDKAPGA